MNDKLKLRVEEYKEWVWCRKLITNKDTFVGFRAKGYAQLTPRTFNNCGEPISFKIVMFPIK